MTVEDSRAVMDAYIGDGGLAVVAEDAVYLDMATGQRFEGREAIKGMLTQTYRDGLDATSEVTSLIVGEDGACMEGAIVGRHTGSYAGVPATGKEVRIPLCVTYRIADGQIFEAHVYVQVATFLAQVAD
jgi:steroid delta-isomerase-like uncharacterized protein